MSDEAASPAAAHLQSESYADSPDEASSSSSHEEEQPEQARRPRKATQRSYNVAAAMEKDEEKQPEELQPEELLPEERHHSTTSDDSSSSSSNSSSSSESCDSDDTGTVADRRPKRRRFNKVFVVNRQPGARRQRRSSSTEGDSLSSSEANLEDSSDNDTDTERTDCGIVLNYVKPLEAEAGEEQVPAAAAARDCQSSDDDDGDDDDDESERHRVANSSDELANCIVVVGGQTDDDGDGVVLHRMRSLPDAEQLERHSNDVMEACEELDSISNDVNRLLELHKQNSQLEIKLQRLRQGVAEINEDLQLTSTSPAATHPGSTTASPGGKPNECTAPAAAPSSRKSLSSVPSSNDGDGMSTCEQVKAQVKKKEQAKAEKEKEEQEPEQTAEQTQRVGACSQACKINENSGDYSLDSLSASRGAPEPLEQVPLRSVHSLRLPVTHRSQADGAAEDESHYRSENENESESEPSPVEHEMLNVAVAPRSGLYGGNNNNNNSKNDTNVNVTDTTTTNNEPGHNDAFAAEKTNKNNRAKASGSDVVLATPRAFESGENEGCDYDKIFGASQQSAGVGAMSTSPEAASSSPASAASASLSAKYRSLVMITKDTASAAGGATKAAGGDYEMASNKGPSGFGQNLTSESSLRALELLSSERDSYSVDSLNEQPELCLEDGLADDDSWVEELSQRGEEEDEEEEDENLSNATTTPTATDSEDAESDSGRRHGYVDREEELRGYNRSAIDFTLHTIVEESCEESEVASLRADNEDAELEDEDLAERRRQRTLQHHHRLSASELEKYFFFGLGDGRVMSSIDTRGDDTASEVSSECSESLDSLPHEEQLLESGGGASDLASSRLEKYFLSGFMGFSGAEKQADSDESGGSVGSDSEGHPSPSQRRKRLVRARGTPRSHNSSLDNLLLPEADAMDVTVAPSASAAAVEDTSESEAGCDDTVIHLANAGASDGSSSDTIKRKKQLRKRHDSLDEKKLHDLEPSECRTPTPGGSGQVQMQSQAKKQQQQHHHSRDSGFVGSNDDLLKAAPDCEPPKSPTSALEQISEDREPAASAISLAKMDLPSTSAAAAAAASAATLALVPSQRRNLALPNLVRKDSFNNWSSDEETNLMMSKMRQFFKTLIVATANAQQSKPTTPNQGQGQGQGSSTTTPSSQRRLAKSRPAQLAYFENELTRLMKTVPGINDDQVREIVEYLSSEDTWSDSYDSSDYTSSDLEGGERKGQLKAQISASCQQIINKFEVDEEGDRGDGGLLDESQAVPMEALVYQKLVASFSKVAAGGERESETGETSKEAEEKEQASTERERSPQLFAKVMQHIGTRLVALMHEVSSGNETPTPSPQGQRHHRRLQAKISATTTEDEEDEVEEQLRAMPLKQLKLRSRSHDLLLDGITPHVHHLHHQATVHHPGGGAGAASGAGGPSSAHTGHSDNAGEECGMASDYERFSWRGSFESALLANGDSRTRLSQLSQLDRDNSSSASALAVAKRRSAGDLLFSQHQASLSREQLDRVRSCGSIGGGDAHHHQLESSPAKPWLSSAGSSLGGDSTKDVRRSSVPDAIYETDSSDESPSNQFGGARSTLPRSLNSGQVVASTNSLPRLPTTGAGGAPITSTPKTKSQSALNYTPSNSSTVSATGSAKSARYRSPGLAARAAAVTTSGGGVGGASGGGSGSTGKKLGAGFQFLYSKRDARKRLNMSAGELLFSCLPFLVYL